MKEQDAVFSPVEATNAGIEEIKKIEQRARSGDDGIRIPIDGLREYFYPLMRGQFCSVIGQPSHGKSWLLNQIMHGIAKDLVAHGKKDWAIVKVSTEDLVEENMLEEISRESQIDMRSLTEGKVSDWGKIYSTVNTLYGLPIYRIGDSLERDDDTANLYLRNVIEMIKGLINGTIYNTPVKIAAIIVDYLQSFPYDPETRGNNGEEKRRLQVRNDVFEIRRLSKIAPIFLGVQAKQTLTGSLSPTMMTPGGKDGEETNSIWQKSDRIITCWMPKNDFSVGDRLEYKGKMYVVDENLQFVRVVKQRGNRPSGKIFVNYLDYGDPTRASMSEF